MTSPQQQSGGYHQHQNNHRTPSQASSSQACRNWSISGTCKFGDSCYFKLSHTKENAPAQFSHEKYGQTTSLSQSPGPTRSGPPPASSKHSMHSASPANPTSSTPITSTPTHLSTASPSTQNQNSTLSKSKENNPSDNELDEHFQQLILENEYEPDDIFGADNDEVVVDPEDLPEGYNPHKTHAEGTQCEVEGCNGQLKPEFNSSGKVMYFQCLSCQALFTNFPGSS